MNTIFVQIASYRDPQLIPTINDLISNAANPKALHIAICFQYGEDESMESFLNAGFDVKGFTPHPTVAHNVVDMEYRGAKFSVIDVPHWESQGACWARNSIQQLYSSEKYTLQLDSHHRFVPNWDNICIKMLEGLRATSPKPLLTAYLPSFDPDNDPAGRVNVPWKMDFDRFIPEGAVFFLPSSIDNHHTLDAPILARFYSAHFAFADGSFAVEVQHDPEYFFHGEEISIAARAFTHGYDLYHPHQLVAWHEYTRKNRTKVWDDHTSTTKSEGKVKKDWLERNEHCHLRNRILFGMDGLNPKTIDFGKYGFGNVRTLRDYERYAGISFKGRGATRETIDRVQPVYPSPHATVPEAQWLTTIIGSHDIRVCFHRNDLIDVLDDYDFWYVGAHDKDGNEIHRKDIEHEEITRHLSNGEWVDFRLIFISNDKPVSYTVWPHSKSRGWMSAIKRGV